MSGENKGWLLGDDLTSPEVIVFEGRPIHIPTLAEGIALDRAFVRQAMKRAREEGKSIDSDFIESTARVLTQLAPRPHRTNETAARLVRGIVELEEMFGGPGNDAD